LASHPDFDPFVSVGTTKPFPDFVDYSHFDDVGIKPFRFRLENPNLTFITPDDGPLNVWHSGRSAAILRTQHLVNELTEFEVWLAEYRAVIAALDARSDDFLTHDMKGPKVNLLYLQHGIEREMGVVTLSTHVGMFLHPSAKSSKTDMTKGRSFGGQAGCGDQSPVGANYHQSLFARLRYSATYDAFVDHSYDPPLYAPKTSYEHIYCDYLDHSPSCGCVNCQPIREHYSYSDNFRTSFRIHKDLLLFYGAIGLPIPIDDGVSLSSVWNSDPFLSDWDSNLPSGAGHLPSCIEHQNPRCYPTGQIYPLSDSSSDSHSSMPSLVSMSSSNSSILSPTPSSTSSIEFLGISISPELTYKKL
jgi:hypothetical protein